MKRYVRAALTTALLTGGLGSTGCVTTGSCDGGCAAGGCATGGCGDGSGTGKDGRKTIEDCYRNFYDVSWPERYNYAARESVLSPFAQQTANGHYLDQTLWNWYFVPGSDRLAPGGMDKLDALARATPAPDPRLFIQTAHDIVTLPGNADKARAARDDLDARRAAAVKTYMAGQWGTPVPYEVYVNDTLVPGLAARFATSSFIGQKDGYKGGLVGGAGALTAGGSTVTPAAGTPGGATPGGGAPGGGAPGGGAPGGAPGGSSSGPSPQ